MGERYVPFETAPTESPQSLQQRYADAIMLECEHLCQTGIHETSWNRGPWIDKALRFVGILEPAPWCTAAACYVLQTAARSIGVTDTCPDFASGAKLARWALKNPDLCTVIYSVDNLKPGDVGIMGATKAKRDRIRRGSLASGHTVIVAGRVGMGRHAFIPTYEGNTNAAGSREGDTFRARHRSTLDNRWAMGIRFKAVRENDAT